MNNFEVITPKSIDDLLLALRKLTPKSKILSGGTDLIIDLKKGVVKPDIILDITSCEDLKYIRKTDKNIYLGSTVTITDIKENSLVKNYAQCLFKMCDIFGSTQIRNRATIGGNIATGSPASDSIPVLKVLDAEISILNSNGETKVLPIDEVVIGPGQTILNYDEVIIGIQFPCYEVPWRGTFIKLGSRRAVTISKISLAINLLYNQDYNIINDIKIALGAVGKTAFRAREIETYFKGRTLDNYAKDDFIKMLAEAIEKSIPGRASLPYKKEAIKGVAYEAFLDLF